MSAQDAMNSIKSLGAVDVFNSVSPTYGAFTPLQIKRLHTLIKPVEFQYASHPRQKLDVYEPRDGTLSASPSKKFPVLFWLYGGGFVVGSKRSESGFYQNVGTFFADLGFYTICMDYRLVKDDGKYPSGAQDLSLALSWLAKETPDKADTQNVVLLGNSAGAVHVATFLWANKEDGFAKIDDIPQVRIVGAGLISPPLSWPSNKANDTRKDVLRAYYGSDELTTKRCPTSLRLQSSDTTPILLAWDEFDPEEEILDSIRDFIKKIETSPHRYETLVISGHNHLSPPLALGLGGTADEWGRQVAGWLQKKITG